MEQPTGSAPNEPQKVRELEKLATFVSELYANPRLKTENYRASITLARPKRGKGTGPNGSKQMTHAIELDSLRNMKVDEYAYPVSGHEPLENLLKKALTFKFTSERKNKHSSEFDELRNGSDILKAKIDSLERKNEDGSFTEKIEEYKKAFDAMKTKISQIATEATKDDSSESDAQKNKMAAKILKIFDAARIERNEAKNAEDLIRQGKIPTQKVSSHARIKAMDLHRLICQKMFPNSEEYKTPIDHKDSSYGQPFRPASRTDTNWRTQKSTTDQANVYIPPHRSGDDKRSGSYGNRGGFRPEHELAERREFQGNRRTPYHTGGDRREFQGGSDRREFQGGSDRREFQGGYQRSYHSGSDRREFQGENSDRPRSYRDDRNSYKASGDSKGSVKYVPPHLRSSEQTISSTDRFEVLNEEDETTQQDSSQEKFPSLVKVDVTEKKPLGAWGISLSREVLTRAPVVSEPNAENVSVEEEDDDISSIYNKAHSIAFVKNFVGKKSVPRPKQPLRESWDDNDPEFQSERYDDYSNSDEEIDDMEGNVTSDTTTNSTAWKADDDW